MAAKAAQARVGSEEIVKPGKYRGKNGASTTLTQTGTVSVTGVSKESGVWGVGCQRPGGDPGQGRVTDAKGRKVSR